MNARRAFRLHVEELEGRLVPSVTPIHQTNSHWSGYAVTTALGAVTSVQGTWVVPQVSGTGKAAETDAWVGIDGKQALNPTVEQIGTASQLNADGTTSYYAWAEMYPFAPMSFATLSPGDTITANVTYVGSGVYNYSLTSQQQGIVWYFSGSFPSWFASSGQNSSAEWIVEAPSNAYGAVLPLAPFQTPVAFSGATTTINGATSDIGQVASGIKVYQINMTGNNNDKTSALNATGDGFTVSFTSSKGVTPGFAASKRSSFDPAPTTSPTIAATLLVPGPVGGVDVPSRPSAVVSVKLPGPAVSLQVSSTPLAPRTEAVLSPVGSGRDDGGVAPNLEVVPLPAVPFQAPEQAPLPASANRLDLVGDRSMVPVATPAPYAVESDTATSSPSADETHEFGADLLLGIAASFSGVLWFEDWRDRKVKNEWERKSLAR